MDHCPLRTNLLKSIAKRGFRAAGWILSLAAIAFFIMLVGQNGISISGRSPLQIAGVVSVGAVAYGMAVVLLSVLWAGLAIPANTERTVRSQLVASYLKSQFAKYLPGNVFQYATRHLLGRQLGISHGALASAGLLEVLLLICAALLMTILFGMPALRTLLPWVPDLPETAGLVVLAIIPALAWAPRPAFLHWIPQYSLVRSAASLGGYVLFFGIFGGLYAAALAWSTETTPEVLQVISGSSLAWLLGFVVPGAPAGAGLREAALTLAAGTNQASPGVLAAIVLFRLATLGGDLLAFLVGWAVLRPGKRRLDDH